MITFITGTIDVEISSEANRKWVTNFNEAEQEIKRLYSLSDIIIFSMGFCEYQYEKSSQTLKHYNPRAKIMKNMPLAIKPLLKLTVYLRRLTINRWIR